MYSSFSDWRFVDDLPADRRTGHDFRSFSKIRRPGNAAGGSALQPRNRSHASAKEDRIPCNVNPVN
jgi:hypothetical protein